MNLPAAYYWSRVPFARLLLALIAGILIEWNCQLPLSILVSAIVAGSLAVSGFSLLALRSRFRFRPATGLAVNFLLASGGALLVWLHDVRQHWPSGLDRDDRSFMVRLEEPPVEKEHSFKALATLEGVYDHNFREQEGAVLIYFEKDSMPALDYGAEILFHRPLQAIRNSGNPGSFDYRQYCLFQGITHQVYLARADFVVLTTQRKNGFTRFIFDCRRWIVKALQTFIKGGEEQGLAEALLIGYKDDLDKDLVQSYTNTGVVHVIAISGMHLALIYGLLVFLARPLQRLSLPYFRMILLLAGLWLFTLLAGAQASVVRSAVMFTCIVFAEAANRKSSIFNTLALSAFILLVYDPFWLWDVGFQLSYAAVISIVVFYKPVYHWLYFPHPLLDFVWKTMAISIAAQIFTTPVSLYHFHQFPVLFLLTNVVAVPLSTFVLFGEIGICACAAVHPLAQFLGKITTWMIAFLNSYIRQIEAVPFSLWNGFSINIAQAVLLFLVVIAAGYWLIEKKKWALWMALVSAAVFTLLRSLSFAQADQQKKLIVYSVPKHGAIDFISGRRCFLMGDSALISDDRLRNYHLQPSRTLHRLIEQGSFALTVRDVEFFDRRILIIDAAVKDLPLNASDVIDLCIFCRNGGVNLYELSKSFTLRQVVIDGSVSARKARLLKKDCDALHIPCHDVSQNGAFVMNL